MRVFISWSGPRSQALAVALRNWIPSVLPHVDPFASEVDVPAGERWSEYLTRELESSNFGLVCLTEDGPSEWQMFEIGQLVASLGVRIAPLLLDEGVSLTGPLSAYMAVKVGEEGLRAIIHSINEVSPQQIPKDRVDYLFHTFWPGLEKRLAEISPPITPADRPDREEADTTVRSSKFRKSHANEAGVPSGDLDSQVEQFSLFRLIKSGIIDYTTLDRQGDVFDLLAGAKRTICICKTWIPELVAVKAGLSEALRDRSHPVEVRILCLDPNSPAATLRSKDVGQQQGRGSEEIRSDLKKLHDFCRANGFLDLVHLRTYDLPSISLYSADDTMLVGWYWHSHLAFDGPVLKVKGEGYHLTKRIQQNFQDIWDSARDYEPEIE